MLNGFWSVVFNAGTDIGAGVVTIIDSQVTGGDSGFAYTGSITPDNSGNVSGELQIARHSRFLEPIVPGLENYTLAVRGTVSDDQLGMTGSVKGQTGMHINIRGKKLLSL